MQLTENFSYEELWESDTATRLGIDNRPPPELLPALRKLAMGLQSMRSILGHPIRVNSGYRCEALERVLCAKDFAAWCSRNGKDVATAWDEYFARKDHPRGYCADITCRPFGMPKEIIRVVHNNGMAYDRMIEEGTWLHVSFAPEARRILLTATFVDGKPSYSEGVEGVS